MIVGAIPFSFMMILMGISLLKALYRDGIRHQEKAIVEVAPSDSTGDSLA